MHKLLQAILNDDRPKTKQLLRAKAQLATGLINKPKLYTSKIFHWIYVGDTALHLAAAGYRVEIVEMLLAAGADANAAKNRRASSPLHYAADGYVIVDGWDPKRQAKTIHALIDAGADIDARDKNGASPLHRAVRTRCADVVKCLLDAGSDPGMKNKSGSTPFHLAVQDTGRGGSGAAKARAEQRRIIELFLTRGVSAKLKDGKGKSVLDCARAGWIREMLEDAT
jgi:phytoene dehydrogenase-like protein